jgi:hypothetical protein
LVLDKMRQAELRFTGLLAADAKHWRPRLAHAYNMSETLRLEGEEAVALGGLIGATLESPALLPMLPKTRRKLIALRAQLDPQSEASGRLKRHDQTQEAFRGLDLLLNSGSGDGASYECPHGAPREFCSTCND